MVAAASIGASARAQYDYHIIVLDPPRGSSGPGTRAFGISGAGEVAGAVVNHAGGALSAFVWLPADRFGIDAGIHHLPSLFPGAPTGDSRANDINNDGRIVGHAEMTGDVAYLWDLGAGTHQLIPGAMPPSQAHAITEGATPIVAGEFTQGFDRRGFRWEHGTSMIAELAPLGTRPTSFALDVDPTGLAVGGSQWGPFVACNLCGAGSQDDICLLGVYWPTGLTMPAPPFPTLDGGGTTATGINDLQFVVGVSAEDPDPNDGISECFSRAVFWSEPDLAGAPLRLPFVPDLSGTPIDNDYRANAISNVMADGTIRVVGRSEFLEHASLWHAPAAEVDNLPSWQVVNLNSLNIRGDCSLELLREATAINDDGWIAGWGTRSGMITPHAFVLIPFNGCAGDLVGSAGSSIPDGCVNVFDMLTLLSRWDTDDCLADLNEDGNVDVFDLLALLNDWGDCDPGAPCGSGSLSATLAEVGLTMDDWDDFMDVMAGEDEREKENWLCWMTNYLTQCQTCPTCIGSDPFAQ